jgi:transcriptional regulator with XRE-family HTH domain
MAERLKALRERLNYSQVDMAAFVGMTQASWDRWETHPPAALNHLRDIAVRYEVSTDYLLGLIDDPAGKRDLSAHEIIVQSNKYSAVMRSAGRALVPPLDRA